MKRLLTTLPISLLCVLPLPALAGPIVDQATVIEGMLANQDLSGAVAESRALTTSIWEQMPNLSFSYVALINEAAPYYGIFNERADNKFKPKEPVLIYAEPIGFGYGTATAGVFKIAIAVDIEVLSDTGEVLGGFKDIATIQYSSRNQMHEVPANLSLNLDGIPPGKYLIKVTMRDRNTPKIGTFDMEIELVE